MTDIASTEAGWERQRHSWERQQHSWEQLWEQQRAEREERRRQERRREAVIMSIPLLFILAFTLMLEELFLAGSGISLADRVFMSPERRQQMQADRAFIRHYITFDKARIDGVKYTTACPSLEVVNSPALATQWQEMVARKNWGPPLPQLGALCVDPP